MDVDRDTPLAKARAIAQSQLDNDVQANRAAQAGVKAAEAQVEQAKLSLEFTDVKSLLDGISGIAQVQIGNLVNPTTVLTSVSQINPTAALTLAFLNSGQACAAGSRLLVPRSRLDEVKRAIRDEMRAFPVDDPADPNTMVGPMVSQKQYERVESYIRKGIEEGAEVLVGGEGHPKGLEAGCFAKPTVFVNVKNGMTIAQEEIFGPVLSVIAYDFEDEAIRIANDSKYGLHSAVLGTDIQRARRVASHLRAGRVVINNMTDDPQAPWGGFKYSGVGREYGKYGIEAFLEPRAILE
jgi:aldehyde dehydrogenase (NAD+)